MTPLPVLTAIFLLFGVVCLTEGATRSTRRRRQIPAQWHQAHAAPMPAPMPLQRYAYVPVDALGRPQQVYPINPFPLQPLPPQRPITQFIRQIAPPAPIRRVVVQAPPPLHPQVVVVPAPPLPECGAVVNPGKCCSNGFKCPEMFHVDEEGRGCLHKGPIAVCCMPQICD